MKKIVSLFVIANLIISMMCPVVGFAKDYDGHWAEQYVDFLAENNITDGDENARPDEFLLRCEFVKMVNKTFGYENNGNAGIFYDVHKSDWYYDDFNIAVQKGYLIGYNNRYNPEDNITRAEMATVLGRILGQEDKLSTDFSDNALIPVWAKGSVCRLQKMGILSGYEDNTFRSEAFLTRAEGFVVFSKIVNMRFDGGKGTEKEPFLIGKPHQLMNIALNPSAHYLITHDLDFLAENCAFHTMEKFQGSLDGGGHRLVGLSTPQSGKYTLFEQVGRGASVKNIVLVNPDNFFSVTESNAGLIENCANTSFAGEQLQFSEYKGGIAGVNTGTISNCYNTSKLVGRTGDKGVGGIAGENRGRISNCFNLGSGDFVNSAGITYANSGSIESSYNAGLLTGEKAVPLATGANKNIIDCAYLNNMSGENGIKMTVGELKSFFTKKGWQYNEKFNIPVLSRFFGNENFSQFSGGDGSSENPYRINDAVSLYYINEFSDSCFIQTKNVDFADIEGAEISKRTIEPIGTSENPFTGYYDGGGNSISRLKMIRPDEDDIGLFGWNNGTIANVKLVDSYIEGNRNVGGIVARNRGIIKNTANFAKVVAIYGAGISAVNEGKTPIIENCYNQGEISASITGAGITLSNYGVVRNCYNSGKILARNSNGLIARNYGNMEYIYNLGELRGNSISALVGDNEGGKISYGYYLEQYSFCSGEKGDFKEITSRTKKQMNYASAFYGFDFINTWTCDADKEYSAPQLINVPHIAVRNVQNVTDFAGGSGSIDDPYRIVTPIHLDNVRKYPNGNFVMMNTLDMTVITSAGGIFYNDGEGFEPIKNLKGIFDGGGYGITGLKINRKGASGLFEDNHGGILNLWINACDIEGDTSGGIAAENYGFIFGCKITGKVDGKAYCGGIAGINTGRISACAVDGTICGEGFIGALAGENLSEISASFNAGEVVGTSGLATISGIASGSGKIKQCYNAGQLYFAKEEGVVYPISNGEYEASYYIKEREDEFKGGINYTVPLSVKDFGGFDFDGTWSMGEDNFPIPDRLETIGISFPSCYKGGDGSEKNPYRIINIDDLNRVRFSKDKHFVLGRDLDLTEYVKEGEKYYNGGRGFLPLGNEKSPFSGNFDGNGYTISGLKMVQRDEDNVGLFGILTGKVFDLKLEECHLEGRNNVGAVAGNNQGQIKKASVKSGRIGASEFGAGGISGLNSGGGLVEGATNGADVFSSGSTGGVVGINQGVLLDCSNIGGIVTTSEDGEGASGGIAGQNKNAISRCFNSGRVVAFSDTGVAISGGIAGINESIISDAYNVGELVSKAKNQGYSGGIAGLGKKNMSISRAYNVGYGNIVAAEAFQGSLVGGGVSGSVAESYYDYTLPVPVGDERIKLINVNGLGPEEMTNPDNFRYLNFAKVWILDEKSEYFYPQLQANPHIIVQNEENFAEFAGGNGTIENPYQIITSEQLNNVRKHLGATYILLGDVDMTDFCREQDFVPIGDNVFSFFGTFMGNDRVISGLVVKNGKCGGLFRQNHGEIYQLGLDDCRIESENAGALAGINTGLIYNCFNLSDVNIEMNDKTIMAGSLVGVNEHTGMIVSSYGTGNISVGGNGVQTGGIACGNYGVIAGCYYSGKLEAKGDNLSMAGGIAAFNYGTISDCYNTEGVSAESEYAVDPCGGGIAGVSGGIIVNCYNAGDKVNAKTYGALVGDNQNGVMVNCYYNSLIDQAIGRASDGEFYAKSKDELKQKETFKDFDFESMWIMTDENGYEYPQFMAIPHK